LVRDHPRRVTPDGERQWRGGDGYWYASEQMALSAEAPSRRHEDFPAPVATLSAGLVWAWPDVAAWAKATGREIRE
jgi:hypothetical protein